MIINVIKSQFKIEADKVSATLEAILKRWPEIKTQAMFKQKKDDAERLQYSLYILGFHTRIHPDGYIMDIKSLQPDPIIKNNTFEVIKLLAVFAINNCWIEYRTDGDKTKIILKFNELNKNTFTKPVEEKSKVKKPGRPKMK